MASMVINHPFSQCRRRWLWSLLSRAGWSLVVWKAARAALFCSPHQNQLNADRRPPRLPITNLDRCSHELPLQVESRKLASCFNGPFEIEKIINLSAVTLKLPPWLKIHPTFHVSLHKHVSSSPLSHPVEPPPISGDHCSLIYVLLDRQS